MESGGSDNRLHIGTSGWSYRHWKGVFYPDNVKPEKFLEYYFSTFECVELNASFYNLPRKTTVEGWLNRTPDTFRFCPKLSRFITHQQQLENAEEALQRFFDVFEVLTEKMGPVLIQLPPGLPYNRELSVHFFNLIKERNNKFRFGVELRNKSWGNDEFMDLLSRNGIASVIADSGKRFPFFEVITTDFIYLRFHGREQLYASDYEDDVLNEYGRKIYRWLADGKEVWVFFNNDYHGYAVKNARRLIEITDRH